jgi:hypothetical protein
LILVERHTREALHMQLELLDRVSAIAAQVEQLSAIHKQLTAKVESRVFNRPIVDEESLAAARAMIAATVEKVRESSRFGIPTITQTPPKAH